ncbi:hypothetical protein [Mesorhizobium sp. M8A.F.Ca.ET.057.01.1.1]|uniref:hypothetical protein n=1 Tax=Mesorhizobium sp. M8A.F.Ca.ET.057.01.1.1 TaxID=2493679 RepID=UPI001FE15708|nr:hypothetical protein [Mesorhizobium sp. M8A.F.Ca.ET.057.01.1.1]
MSHPREPDPNRDVPMPAPNWKPEPIGEPEPDGLPDEAPLPNPDENEEPRCMLRADRIAHVLGSLFVEAAAFPRRIA